VLEESRYVKVGYWVSQCPAGTMNIPSVAECSTAAGHVGHPWGGAGSWDQAGPACQVGCRNKVYFNYDLHSQGGKLICKTVRLCSASAPADCASCTVAGGSDCEQCADFTTLLPDGTCRATCADFSCPVGFAVRPDTRPLVDPDVDRCCIDGRNGIVQSPYGELQCPAGTETLDAAACEELAREGSLAVKKRNGDQIQHPAPFEGDPQPTWSVYRFCPNGCIMYSTSRKYYFNTVPSPFGEEGYRACSVICRAPTPAPAPQPAAPTLPPPPALRDTLLGKHNSLRAQEGSSSMPKLVWDPALEATAQRWADKCSFNHASAGAAGYSDCAGNACGQPHGENLWMGSADDPDLAAAVEAWYNEKLFYVYGDGTYSPDNCFIADNGCGHYTQIVSHTSLRLGCGVKTDCAGQWKSYLVCQYDPPGNVVGNTLYKTGPACSECPAGYNSCEGGLCVGNGTAAPTTTAAPTPAAPTPTTPLPATWTLMLRQTLPYLYTPNQLSVNPADPANDNYAILESLESCRKTDGHFNFKLSWPGTNLQEQVWKQISNPVTHSGAAQGYEAISAPYTQHNWGGLEKNGDQALLDGSIGGMWWYAVGARRKHRNGIPAASTVVQKVELFADCDSPPPPPPTTTPFPAAWTLMLRQTLPYLYTPNQLSVNPADPANDNYAILESLESCRKTDGHFNFKLSWPGADLQEQVWKQTSNPVIQSGAAQGYEAISAPYAQHNWGGLEKNGNQALLDGSIGGWWWYAVGARKKHRNGIPAASTVVQKVELYADCAPPP